MLDLFIDPTRLIPARLGADAPRGLFLVYSHPHQARWFYVAGDDGERVAILLETQQEEMLFQLWKLGPDLANWQGVSFGEVEVLVDAASGIAHRSPHASAGSIWIGDGGVHVIAKPGRGWQTNPIRIGDSQASAGTEGASFSRWRFVQRDHDGRPTTLFQVGNFAGSGDR